jgi:hypothetical protein
MPRGILRHRLLVPSRRLAYVVYCGLTLAAFVCAALYPGNVTIGLATNLLGGVIVVTFIDSLIRRADELRVRPLRIAALMASGRIAQSLGDMIGEAFVSVRLWNDEYQVSELNSGRIGTFIGHKIVTRDLLDDRNDDLYASYARTANMIAESVDLALGTFGFAQEPELVPLLVRVRSLSLLTILRRPFRAKRDNLGITPHHWDEMTEACNHLSDAMERAASRCPGFYFTPPRKYILSRLASAKKEADKLKI